MIKAISCGLLYNVSTQQIAAWPFRSKRKNDLKIGTVHLEFYTLH